MEGSVSGRFGALAPVGNSVRREIEAFSAACGEKLLRSERQMSNDALPAELVF